MKIAVVQKDFYIGGISSSCINFLNSVSKEQDIDLTLFTFDKINEDILSSNVNIVYANKSLTPFAVSYADSKKRGIFFRLKWLFLRLWSKVFTNRLPLKFALKRQKEIKEQFDVAISFAPSTSNKTFSVGSSEFVLQKVNAKKKFILFHSDFQSSGLNTEFVVDGLSKFDKILCVSKSCAEKMKQALPQLQEKIDYLYNFSDSQTIIEKAKEYTVDYSKDVFNIVSVSRISEEKGHLRTLNVLKNLHNINTNFVWHIVGDGKIKEDLETFVKTNDMDGYVKFYGNKSNPYPYIKNADLFFLGSYHEAAPMVYAEAMTLGVPVLTTKTCSAEELVGNLGFVCENSKSGILEELKHILENRNLVVEKQKQLENYNYPNKQIVDKIRRLCE